MINCCGENPPFISTTTATILFYIRHLALHPLSCSTSAILFYARHLVLRPPSCSTSGILIYSRPPLVLLSCSNWSQMRLLFRWRFGPLLYSAVGFWKLILEYLSLWISEGRTRQATFLLDIPEKGGKLLGSQIKVYFLVGLLYSFIEYNRFIKKYSPQLLYFAQNRWSKK